MLCEICKSFRLLPQGLLTKKRFCFRKPSEELEREWKNGIDELDGRCHDLLLQEHCKKLFNLMDVNWCGIKYVEFDIYWLIKRKKLRNMSTNSLLEKLVLERFDKQLPFFKFKYDFNVFCYSKFPDFENLYTLLTINKGTGVFRTSSFSQASQDESAVCDLVKFERGGRENEIISSAGILLILKENMTMVMSII